MTDDDVVAYLSGETENLPRTTESARIERTRALLAEPSLWAEPSLDLEQRVVDAITVSPGSSSYGDPSVTPLAAGRRATPRWVRLSLLGAAAAVLLAIGLGAVLVTQRDRPMEFAATMQGTQLAATAKGTVTLTKTTSGWRIHLRATGLPRLDNGSYYQGWLKDAAGTLVPIGTFNQATDVTLWSGVPPSSYPTITITRQQAGAGPASSGQKVLVGTSHRTQ